MKLLFHRELLNVNAKTISFLNNCILLAQKTNNNGILSVLYHRDDMICGYDQSQLHLGHQSLPGVGDTSLEIQVYHVVLDYLQCLSDQVRLQLLASLGLPGYKQPRQRKDDDR